jgi:hypothetical protein
VVHIYFLITVRDSAGRTARRKELLQIAQRDSRFGCDLARTEIRIGATPHRLRATSSRNN